MKPIIQNPCHESWQNMTPNAEGRFCGQCQKTVIDFSQMTTKEIEDYLKVHSQERTCGRFQKNQIATNKLTIKKPFYLTHFIPVIRYAFAGFIAFLSSCFGGESSRTTGEITEQNKIDTIEHLIGDTVVPYTTSLKKQKSQSKIKTETIIQEQYIVGDIEVPDFENKNETIMIVPGNIEIKTDSTQ